MIAAAAPTFPHLRNRVATPPGQHRTPPRRPAVTCNNAIQVTIYNCRISQHIAPPAPRDASAAVPPARQRRRHWYADFVPTRNR